MGRERDERTLEGGARRERFLRTSKQMRLRILCHRRAASLMISAPRVVRALEGLVDFLAAASGIVRRATVRWAMSFLLPHLRNGWAVDQAILTEEERVVCVRFGRDADDTCMRMDEVRSGRANLTRRLVSSPSRWRLLPPLPCDSS